MSSLEPRSGELMQEAIGQQNAGLLRLDERVDALERLEYVVREHHMALWSAQNLATGSLELRIYNLSGRTMTISRVALSVGTAPTGSAIIVDVHKDGTTIFTNQAHRPQIAASAFYGDSTDVDVSSWADASYLTVEIDQVGSTIIGDDLVVHVVVS